ncbi:MAG: HAD family hydrolase [Lachnospiraceae bacterium]|nr:HAD family hydrolase [Lachnospiraceae bacterium]
MAVFHVDLDNTLIFSYKRDIGQEKRCVEVYQGREISFITEKTYELLQKVRERALIVPTTTRTQEQYRRIDLGIGDLPYALVCNGGVLLENGKEDEKWRARSLELVRDCQGQLRKAMDLLEKEPERELEVRFLEEMFVFTKCRNPAEAVDVLRESLDTGLVDVLRNGQKVYVVPKSLRKGRAVERFRQYKRAGQVFAAGDSAFDVTMLEAADLAVAPQALKSGFSLSACVTGMLGKAVYSEEVLEYILNFI